MTNDYQIRLDQVNKDADERNILASIDRPIRELIIHMNRIGIRTIFSCCGFSYEPDEGEEPKTHATETFVNFYGPRLIPKEVMLFHEFVNSCHTSYWKVGMYAAGALGKPETAVWTCRLRGTIDEQTMAGPGKFYDRGRDGIVEGIHDYEVPLIRIDALCKVLKKWPALRDTFEIVDGNRQYKDVYGLDEWQVKPKKTVVFHVAEGDEGV